MIFTVSYRLPPLDHCRVEAAHCGEADRGPEKLLPANSGRHRTSLNASQGQRGYRPVAEHTLNRRSKHRQTGQKQNETPSRLEFHRLELHRLELHRLEIHRLETHRLETPSRLFHAGREIRRDLRRRRQQFLGTIQERDSRGTFTVEIVASITCLKRCTAVPTCDSPPKVLKAYLEVSSTCGAFLNEIGS